MSNTWMSRLAVSELSTYRWTFEEDVLRYKEHGFSAVGVWRPKLADCGESKGCELLLEQGLKVSSLNWIGGFTGNDGRSYKDAMHDALDAVDVAAQIGADCLVVLAGDLVIPVIMQNERYERLLLSCPKRHRRLGSSLRWSRCMWDVPRNSLF